jgi:uncharacterized RDD family membrane protein YckC
MAQSPRSAQLRDTDVLTHDDDHGDLVTGEAVALQLLPTSFVLRAAGGAIDFLVYAGGTLLIAWGLGSLMQLLGADAAVQQATSIACGVIGLVAIPTGVELATQGRSLGRLAVGARIVRDDGGAIGFRHAFIRSLVGLFEVFGTFGGLAVLVALLNAKSKRFGDMLAGTYSQQERIRGTPTPVFGVPYELTEWSRTADVARMPDPLARRVSTFLAQAATMLPASRDRHARDLANEVAVYVSPIPVGASAELFLAAVSVIRREREFAALQREQRGLETLQPALKGQPHAFPDRG